jgi:hypothetical protein
MNKRVYHEPSNREQGLTSVGAQIEIDWAETACWISFRVLLTLWQIGACALTTSVAIGFALTLVFDPMRELETPHGKVVFFTFFAIELFSVAYVVWVSLLMIKNSRRFPVAWTIEAFPVLLVLFVRRIAGSPDMTLITFDPSRTLTLTSVGLGLTLLMIFYVLSSKRAEDTFVR